MGRRRTLVPTLIPTALLAASAAAITVPARATFDALLAPGPIGLAWTMPWQLSPASAASRAQGERTELVDLPGYGLVRGTPDALRYLFSALPVQPGRNSLVETCRAKVAAAAGKLGTVQVEAASAGRERRMRESLVAPVSFRLIYARFNGRENYEVRQSTLTCRTDRTGAIIDAAA